MIPNTVAIYTSKPRWGFISSDGIVTFTSQLRRMTVYVGEKYDEKKFHVIWHLNESSDDTFINAWSEDGIYALAFGGHGNRNGFVADSSRGSDGTAVAPNDVSPPYKLRFVGAFACFTTQDYFVGYGPGGTPMTMRWKDHVSKLGGFTGYNGMVNWVSGMYDYEME